MNRKRKAIILICIAIPSAIFLTLAVQPAFWDLIFQKEDVRVAYSVSSEYQRVWVTVSNEGYTTINISRVELIYLPDETLGLIRTGQIIIERHISVAPIDWKPQEQSDFFDLLLESEGKVRIEVETSNKIYIYYPERIGYYVKPTSIEKK